VEVVDRCTHLYEGR